MAKFLVKDLKKVNRSEPLNLKNELAIKISNSQLPSKTLDLRPLQAHQQKKSSKKSKTTSVSTTYFNNPTTFRKNLENITSDLPAKTFFYLPQEKLLRPPRFARYFSTLKFAALGLLIAFTFNLINVVQNSYHLKSQLIGSASAGFNGILEATTSAKNKNFSGAENEFKIAEKSFDQALEKISFLSASQHQELSNEKNTTSVSHLLAAGKSISQAGQLFSQAGNNLQNLPSLFIQSNKEFLLKKNIDKPTKTPSTHEINNATGVSSPSLTDLLKLDLNKVDQAISHLQQAQIELAQTDSALIPTQYRNELISVQDKLSKLNQFLVQMRDNFPAILNLLGDRYPHRYLLLLQNDTESRPTGGFIGSLMILDINNGYITRADFHDVYQYDGQLLEKITPPEEISKITDSWHFRDSNYSPDFALSAEKAAWFLQKSKGPSVDSVIAINQSLIPTLLNFTGPLQIPELKSELTAENFQFVLSYLIESKYYGKSQPKIILEKTIYAFQQKILKLNQFQPLLGLLTEGIKNQKIMFYSRDAQVQNFFEFLNLTPHQKTISNAPDKWEDYLQVIASSTGGNKSDAFMSQNLDHKTFISGDGTVIDELTITRHHNWTTDTMTNWQQTLKKFGFTDLPDNLADLMGRGTNRASIKVYLPLGTKLINTVGMDSSKVSLRSDAESQKSFLLFSIDTIPGLDSTVTFRYQLPNKLTLLPADIYRFSAQGQPGLIETNLTKQLQISPELNLLKTTPDLSIPLSREYYYSAAISS